MYMIYKDFYKNGFAPLERPTIYVGDNKNNVVYCTFGMMYVQEGSPSDMHC